MAKDEGIDPSTSSLELDVIASSPIQFINLVTLFRYFTRILEDCQLFSQVFDD